VFDDQIRVSLGNRWGVKIEHMDWSGFRVFFWIQFRIVGGKRIQLAAIKK